MNFNYYFKWNYLSSQAQKRTRSFAIPDSKLVFKLELVLSLMFYVIYDVETHKHIRAKSLARSMEINNIHYFS